jgi:hypothetical protein
MLALAALAACATSRAPLPPRERSAEPVLAPSVHEPHPGEEVSALDVDGDGVFDTWTYTVVGADGARAITRRERDLDGDGRTDVWEDLVDGRVALRALDLDGDGRPDLVLRYDARGGLAVKEYAFGADGHPRVRAFYEGGALVRRERDRDGDGKPDAWERWVGGELDEVSAAGEPARRRPAAPVQK